MLNVWPNDNRRASEFVSAALGVPSRASKVVGFFSGAGEMEEDEMEDFSEAAADLKHRSDVYFGIVDDAAICEHYKKLGWIQRASEAVLTR